MSDFISAELEFEEFGNRRGFTGMRLISDAVAAAFVEQFRHCFEYALNQDALLLIEPEAQHAAA